MAEDKPVGAGMMLADGTVLTCAHVVTAAAGYPPGAEFSLPGLTVVVSFLGLPGVPSTKAAVLTGHWVPRHEDESGDLALLALESVPQGVTGAPLRRLPAPRNRAVSTYGFPESLGYSHVVWAHATLAGPTGPNGEWVQVDSAPGDQRIRRGFSGAAVIDDHTGSVVGMVVSKYQVAEHTDEDAGLSWMIPVDTVVRYFRRVQRCTGPDLEPVQLGRILVLLGGPPGPDLARAPGRMIVDAAGLTPGEVHHGIESRISSQISRAPGRPPENQTDQEDQADPVTVEVTGVDESRQPEVLLNDVVKPLLDNGTEVGLRFVEENSPVLGIVRRWQREEIDSRLTALRTRVAAVERMETAARERHAVAVSIVTGVPEVPLLAPDLHLRVRALAGAGPGVEPGRVRDALASTERKTERAARALHEIDDHLAAATARYDELRGLLRAYNARAADHGLVEDEELSGAYRPAMRALGARPANLAQAEPLVRRYLALVRQRLDGLDGGTGVDR